jgi:hypothetical protein
MPRRPLDAYMTPEHYIRCLLDRVPIGGTVFEPCAGDGAIARFFPGCDTNDIDPDRKADYHFDAAEPWPLDGAWDWIVTNPPFSDAFEVWQQAMVGGGAGVAMLFRISFFEPTQERAELLNACPPDSLIYLPRYSFTLNGKSDMSTCCWGVWGYKAKQPIQVAPRFP